MEKSGGTGADVERGFAGVSFFWPVLLIGLGVILLLERTGAFPRASEAWPGLLRLWPVLFILIGLDMLSGQIRKFGKLTGLIIALILIGFVSLALYDPSILPPTLESSGHRHETLALERDGVERIDLTVSMDDGDTKILPMGRREAEDIALAADAYGYDPVLEYQIDEGVAYVSLSEGADWGWAFWTDPSAWFSGETESPWEVRIVEGLPCSISLSFDDGSHDLRLGGLAVDEMTVAGDDGNVLAVLPYRLRYGTFTMDDGSLEIRLPDVERRSIGVSLELSVDNGIIILPDILKRVGIRQGDQIWQTDNFEDSEVKLRLEITIDDGDLTIR